MPGMSSFFVFSLRSMSELRFFFFMFGEDFCIASGGIVEAEEAPRCGRSTVGGSEFRGGGMYEVPGSDRECRLVSCAGSG